MSANTFSLLAADGFRLVARVRSRLQLRRKAAGTSVDFIYERYALFQELGSVARRATGAPWFLEVNALLAVEATSERRATTSRRVAEWMERRTLRRADRIVVVTQALRDQVASRYGIAEDRMLVVPNGVDHTVHRAADPTRQSLPPRIGFLGTLYSWQNVSSLLRSMTAEGVGAVELDVAGDGPERQALEVLARELGIEARVHFRGRVHPDAVPEFLAGVDVCFAGHSSGNGSYFSPLKLWEYLAAGKPVIASRHEITTDLQETGFAVVCFDSSDPEDLDRILVRSIAELPDLARRAADKQAVVWAEHSWERRVEGILSSARATV